MMCIIWEIPRSVARDDVALFKAFVKLEKLASSSGMGRYYPTLSDMHNATQKFFKEIACYKEELRTLLSENFQTIRV